VTVLSRVAFDVESGEGFAHKKIPKEMQIPVVVSDGSSVGSAISSLTGGTIGGGGRGGGGGGGGGGGQPGPQNKKQKFNPSVGAAFAQQFRADIDRAAKATVEKGGRFFTHKLIPRTDMAQLLGSPFLALVPEGQSPCFNYFVCGKCSKADDCPYTHALKSDPNKNVLDAIAKRLKTRVNKYIADLAKE
jgi:hypothetical protein